MKGAVEGVSDWKEWIGKSVVIVKYVIANVDNLID